MVNWLSRVNPLAPLIRRWFTPIEQVPLKYLVARARRGPSDSPATREVLKRFGVTLIAILRANGIVNPQPQFRRLISEALKDLSDPELFSAALWDAVATSDPENARYSHDQTFFMIQFIHDLSSPERETLVQALMRPPSQELAALYAPSSQELIRAFGSLWTVMLQHADRDEAKFALCTKGFFKRSRVERLKRRHDAGESIQC